MSLSTVWFNYTLPMIRTLAPWEEAGGTLLNIEREGPCLKLDFGKFQVMLRPVESDFLKGKLNNELLGKRISLLKTDIPAKPLLMRRL